MLAGQTLRAADGYEVALFPMPYLYMSQDEGGDYSHQGTYNIDLLGWNGSARVLAAPIYAPVSCKVVYVENTYASGNMRVFESLDVVHTPSGLQKILFYFNHDNNPVATTVGQVFNQGDVCSHTGTYGNVTGDHTHTCMGYGEWVSFSVSMTTRPTGHEDLTNRLHYWDAVYINDTGIVQGYNHDWRIWEEPTPPYQIIFNRFPWVLYTRRLRKRRS